MYILFNPFSYFKDYLLGGWLRSACLSYFLSLSLHYRVLSNLCLALTDPLFFNTLGTDQTLPYASLPNPATLTNQSDCWLCQHLDNGKEPELVFAPADVNPWLPEHGRWTDDKVWYSQPEEHHSASFPGELLGLQKISAESQGLSLVRVKAIAEKFPLCIENRLVTGLFLGDTPKFYCNQILWFDTKNSIFKLSKEIKNNSSIDICQITKCFIHQPCTIQDTSATPLLDYPIPQTIFESIKTLDALG